MTKTEFLAELQRLRSLGKGREMQSLAAQHMDRLRESGELSFDEYSQIASTYLEFAAMAVHAEEWEAAHAA